MKVNIQLLTKDTSSITSKQSWSYVFINVSHLSSFNALSYDWFLFNGIAIVKCIVVPLMLNVTFHVYVNFMTFGFKGSAFGWKHITMTPFM